MTHLSKAILSAIVCLAVLVCGAVCSSAETRAADSAARRTLNASERAAFIDQVRRLQAGLQTFQAGFKESRSLAALKNPVRYEGRLYYDRKGLFFMEYTAPFKHIMRVQSKEALFYVEGSQTADIADLSNVDGLAQRPDIFGWNPDDFKGQVFEDSQGYVLEEASPAAQQQAGRKLTIILDRTTLLAKYIRIQDRDDVTEIILSDAQLNKALPDAVTKFSLPATVKLNRMGKP